MINYAGMRKGCGALELTRFNQNYYNYSYLNIFWNIRKFGNLASRVNKMQN